MAIQKAIHDCATGKTVIVDMDPAEEAKLLAQWAEPATVKPVDKIAQLEARIAALEGVKTR